MLDRLMNHYYLLQQLIKNPIASCLLFTHKQLTP